MSDTAAIGERDEAVAEAITNGRSLQLVRKEFSLTEAELDAVLERLWPVSTEARIRMIKHDVGCLQRLIEKWARRRTTDRFADYPAAGRALAVRSDHGCAHVAQVRPERPRRCCAVGCCAACGRWVKS